MTGKTISIHSSRGGTGKTVMTTNIAMALAKKGLNVALLDMDFRAPSLSIVFSKQLLKPVNFWLNDFLDGRCTARQVGVAVPKTGLLGKVFLCLANPEVSAITAIMEKNRDWEVNALKKIFALRKFLFDEMNVDYCFFDTSPGMQYSSVNAAVASDLTVLVTTLDMLDMDSIKRLLEELYDNVAKKTAIILNKVYPETCAWSKSKQEGLISLAETTLGHEVLGVVPCYCHVLQSGRVSFFAENKPFQPFLDSLELIVTKLQKIA
jgi:septum site-determining protein MinD